MFLKTVETIGKLEVITGSMFSGKSEELIRRLRRAKYARQKVMIFKHSIDKRYGDKGVYSHGKENIEAYPVSNVSEIEKIVKNHPDVEVIGIDEIQFFGEEAVEWCSKYVELGKRVIVAGLDLDFRAEPFWPMPTLMAIADTVDKFQAICTVCGNNAYASQRLINGNAAYYDDPLVMVGAEENYEARCRRHHIIRRREDKKAKIYFLIGTDINSGKEKVENFYKTNNPSKNIESINIGDETQVRTERKNILEKLKTNDILFVRIIGSPLCYIEGQFTILDLMSEFRKDSEVILISKNRKGLLNNILTNYGIVKKTDLNIKDIYYTIDNSIEREEEEIIEKLEKITKIKGIRL